jgi:hypothetical protein
MQAAPWTASGRFLQDFYLGLDAADEKKEAIKHDGAPNSDAEWVQFIRVGLPWFSAETQSYSKRAVNTGHRAVDRLAILDGVAKEF